MEKTTQYQNGVIGIISRAREVNPEIGSYVEHFINGNMRITVRLSNGRMHIPLECAQDQETASFSIDDKKIEQIANTFQNDNPQAQRVQRTTSSEIKKKSLWTILAEMLGLN